MQFPLSGKMFPRKPTQKDLEDLKKGDRQLAEGISVFSYRGKGAYQHKIRWRE
jgi:hypothetical protein